ncbi:hypothetical protein LguiA_018828 [Lonicera macranthoides]
MCLSSFIQFVYDESVNSAIEKLNGSIVNGKQMYVGKFVKKSECALPSPDNPDDVRKAMETMNGLQLGLKMLYVVRAQKNVEQEQILRRQFEDQRK